MCLSKEKKKPTRSGSLIFGWIKRVKGRIRILVVGWSPSRNRRIRFLLLFGRLHRFESGKRGNPEDFLRSNDRILGRKNKKTKKPVVIRKIILYNEIGEPPYRLDAFSVFRCCFGLGSKGLSFLSFSHITRTSFEHPWFGFSFGFAGALSFLFVSFGKVL